MTGAGHRWTGVGAAFIAATIAHIAHMPDLIAGAIAAASCRLPDTIEIPIYKGGQRMRTLIPHRTITHWPPLWLGLIIWSFYLGDISGAVILGGAIGALTHILGDAPNPMGIPWFVPHERVKFGKRGWWKSGEHEPLMALSYAVIGFALWRSFT